MICCCPFLKTGIYFSCCLLGCLDVCWGTTWRVLTGTWLKTEQHSQWSTAAEALSLSVWWCGCSLCWLWQVVFSLAVIGPGQGQELNEGVLYAGESEEGPFPTSTSAMLEDMHISNYLRNKSHLPSNWLSILVPQHSASSLSSPRALSECRT